MKLHRSNTQPSEPWPLSARITITALLSIFVLFTMLSIQRYNMDKHSVKAAGIPNAKAKSDEVKNRVMREGKILEQANKVFKDKHEVDTYARYICYQAIVNTQLCSTVPVKYITNPNASGTASLTLGSGGNRMESIDLNKAVLTMTPKRAAFLFAHEWTHGDIALLTGTGDKYNEMAKRATRYYYRLDGNPIDPTLAMEVQTDCMAYSRSWVRWVDGYPGYLSLAGAVETTPRHPDDATTTCIYWKDVLQGDKFSGDTGKK